MSEYEQMDERVGVPLDLGPGTMLDDSMAEKIVAQKAELESLGVLVNKVYLAEPGAEPRFFISYQPDTPSFKTRIAMEKEGWDVGQQMGDKMLFFYAAKRAKKSKGWLD